MAKDPASGALYYFNETTGKSQWEKPAETISYTPRPSPLSLPEDWVEAFDETTGMLKMLHMLSYNLNKVYQHPYLWQYFILQIAIDLRGTKRKKRNSFSNFLDQDLTEKTPDDFNFQFFYLA